MQQPEEVELSHDAGKALIDRLEGNALTADDRRSLAKLITFHFWLLFALQEAKLSLNRLRAILFGEKPKKRPKETSSSGSSGGGRGTGGVEAASTESSGSTVDDHSPQTAVSGHRPGLGRQGAEAYRGAERVMCRHGELAVGERCPAYGQGRLYQLPLGVEIRIDGNALLAAVCYAMEKLRCSACGQVFTARLVGPVGFVEFDFGRSRQLG
jgi:transposase